MTRFWRRRFAAAAICGATLASCTNAPPGLRAVVSDYYAVYAERSDAEAFLSFHADSVELRDYVAGERIQGVEALREFFDWGDPSFRMRDSVALVVQDIVVEANRAVVKGHFTPFAWAGLPFEAMQFTTILTFDAEQRIALQEDWINYPTDLLDYDSRKNSNHWIPGFLPDSLP